MSTAASAILFVGRLLFVGLFMSTAVNHIRSRDRYVAIAKGRIPIPYVAGWPAGVWLLVAAVSLDQRGPPTPAGHRRADPPWRARRGDHARGRLPGRGVGLRCVAGPGPGPRDGDSARPDRRQPGGRPTPAGHLRLPAHRHAVSPQRSNPAAGARARRALPGPLTAL